MADAIAVMTNVVNNIGVAVSWELELLPGRCDSFQWMFRSAPLNDPEIQGIHMSLSIIVKGGGSRGGILGHPSRCIRRTDIAQHVRRVRLAKTTVRCVVTAIVILPAL